MRNFLFYLLFLFTLIAAPPVADGQTNAGRILSGVVMTARNESVEGATITVRYSSGEQRVVSDADGAFRIVVPLEPLTLKVEGKNIAEQESPIGVNDKTENLRIEIQYNVPPVHETVLIVASHLDPVIDRRNDAVYSGTLFSRDDQLFHTLDAGISAGQHEGGGKSVEVRRFGFNLDHGGVGGGLKVLVDDVQQNQATQGHGQGYLGGLKSLTPELVNDVDILNGPFSAEYGDFSGLGVVHIRLKESLPDRVTLRLQGGSFNTFRTFAAYSPELKSADSLIAYEASRTDGPFDNPLRYKRDNLTANYSRRLSADQVLGFKLNAGRNDFFSSGQLPLDEVAAGRLDRFGFIDPDDGGRVRSLTGSTYYRRDFSNGDVLKLDGFVSRSLFDLYSNFTFFLKDPVNGDEIQQHDSRLQDGANAQYLHPYKFFGRQALFNAGANILDSHINVGLYSSVARNPISTTESANVHLSNVAGYVQQGVDFLQGHLRIEGGLRCDYFRFAVTDRIDLSNSGIESASRFEPKLNLAYTFLQRTPLTLHVNYGRGISSQDARSIVREPSAEKVSATDFYQVGLSSNLKRLSFSGDLFLIDRSNEQVYIPDDGSIELRGPSRSYGFEAKTSLRLTDHLSFDGGLTKVSNAFYRGTTPREYISNAPHAVANAALTLNEWHGLSGSLRYRYISAYRLDESDARIRATGLSVLDLNLSRRVRRWLDLNASIDNLTNKAYYETQNYFESRVNPSDPIIARIHGTPGYPISLSVGLTFRFLPK
ncbi:MAG TPA: TonB-dependent receptor [Blastocatellia bacterium]|nr:TonB-dependent receptor [Blastocatellia bacterium]